MKHAAAGGWRHRALLLEPECPPGWLAELLPAPVAEVVGCREGVVIRADAAPGFQLLEAMLARAGQLDDNGFQVAVTRCYRALLELMRDRHLFPLRFWNYVPDIHRRVGELSRYEIFNAGRFLGYSRWYGTREFAGRLPAASAVGHRGEDLLVHVLAAAQPGIALENPRQIPAYRYSRRYGPIPPCFARASLLAQLPPARGRWAIIAGTASIVGEETRHPADLEGQLQEILENLAALSSAAGSHPASRAGRARVAGPNPRALSAYRDLRVYLVSPDHANEVALRLQASLPRLRSMELRIADLCRPELLVEVEGLLWLDEPDGETGRRSDPEGRW